MIEKNTILHNFIQKNSKKEILVKGFYLFFLFVITLAMVLDYAVENYQDAFIEFLFIILTLGSLLYNRYVKNIDVALNSIVIIATLLTYVLLISNNFQMSIFHIIIPLSYFLLYTLRRSLIYFFIHETVVTGIYLYGYYYMYDGHGFSYQASDIVAIFMATLVILFIGIFYHLGVEETYQQLEKANHHNKILLQEVHHRVKNNLNIIASILGLQMRNIKRGITKNSYEALKENKLRIESIAMIHEALYKSKHFDKIDFKKYALRLINLIGATYDKKVEVDVNADNISFALDTMLRLGIILNELFTNSIKYAFSQNSTKNQVNITLTKQKEHYTLIYHEYGNQDADIDKITDSATLGMKLIFLTVREMDGTIQISKKDGLVFTIQFTC